MTEEPIEPEIRTYAQRRRVELSAFKYDGTFPLAFLRDDEKVGRSPNGPDGQILIESNGTYFTVDLGWYVLRTDNGLGAMAAEGFENTYEVLA